MQRLIDSPTTIDESIAVFLPALSMDIVPCDQDVE